MLRSDHRELGRVKRAKSKLHYQGRKLLPARKLAGAGGESDQEENSNIVGGN